MLSFVALSIQLVSPASGESLGLRSGSLLVYVLSIQLVSPASGECVQVDAIIVGGHRGDPFHSISFPSEWGVLDSGRNWKRSLCSS
jgi:hypothetical protein